MTSSSGAGTPGAIPALPAAPAAAPAGAPAPTTPGAPATGALGAPPGAPTPATPATPATPPAALTADEVRDWLIFMGMGPAVDEDTVRGHIESLDGCVSDRQLGNTLGWIRDDMVAAGWYAVDPTGVTIASLRSDIAAAAAAMAPPAPPAPKVPSRAWLAVLWCIGAISLALAQLKPLGRRAVTGIASSTRTIGRRWKPLLITAASLALLVGLVFGAIKGYEWWQTRALEAAQTPPAPAEPLPPVAVAPAPEPLPPVAVAPAPEPTPPVAVAPAPEPSPVVVAPTPEPSPVVVAPTPEPPPSPTEQPVVIPGPTKPAIYHPNLDMECLMYGRLQACNLPPGCTEGFVTNPPRLQVSCPGGVTYIDGRSMTEYSANQRVSVSLHRQ